MPEHWQTGVLGLIVAAGAAAWPALAKIKIPSAPATTANSFNRAAWVNNLFELAAVADAQSQPDIAAAARALIAALVAGKESAK
ncbi:MAG: hypothetical protein EBR88_00110 [Betaproteobacteria bacterium]|nr:hypothetical protein [Betaproteobacteria bacterium]